MFRNADAANLPLENRSVNLVAGSPPYRKRRTYGTTGMRRETVDWVDWMMVVTREGLRVSKGPVVWVVNGGMENGKYEPAVEGLIWEAYRAGIHCEHPLIWSKNAAPNRDNWWCNGWEYIVAFFNEDWDHHFDWKAVASAQKYMNGGGFRQRQVNGNRKVQPAKPRNELARPYDILRVTVGGGHMGHPLNKENEAPYPEKLVEPIILALTRPGDIVADPFSGSGTTVCVAERLGRIGRGYDLRNSQIRVGNLRLYGSPLPPKYKLAPFDRVVSPHPAKDAPGST